MKESFCQTLLETYVINLSLAKTKQRKQFVMADASSRITAIPLEAGRTANSGKISQCAKSDREQQSLRSFRNGRSSTKKKKKNPLRHWIELLPTRRWTKSNIYIRENLEETLHLTVIGSFLTIQCSTRYYRLT